MKSFKFSLLSILVLSAATPAFACDLCGCYLPQLEVVPKKTVGFYAGVAEQFTNFNTERLNGVTQPNPAGEFIKSSNTQIVLGATFFENRLGLQINVPLIYRSYQRLLGCDINRGNVSGLGDISLTANVIVWNKEALFHEEAAVSSKDGKSVAVPRRGELDFSMTVNVLAGIKLPTGSPSILKENFAPEVDGAPDSGIGPHDLTLGTGSVDGIFGAQTEIRYKALFFEANAQYTARGYGAYQYRFANDLSWSGGPGVYFFRKKNRALALQCAIAGETKGYDRFQGMRDLDSGVTALSIGPRVIAAFGRVSGEVGLDLPVIMNSTAYQLTPNYRIRAALTVMF